MNKSRPVVIFGSLLAALQFLSTAAALSNVIGKQTFGLFVLFVSAVQIAWAFYQQSTVVPVGDTGAYINSNGEMVAGPAASQMNGSTVAVVLEDRPRAGEGMPEFMYQDDPKTRDDRGAVDTRLIAVIALVVAVVVLAIILL